MKKIIFVIYVIAFCSCANQPMRSELVQSKVFMGMSLADVISTLDIPEAKKPLGNEQIQLIYTGYLFNFKNGLLSSFQNSTKSGLSEFTLKPAQDYKPDSLILNKEINPEATAYKVAAYLQDENLFEKAVEAGINPNGFTEQTNALCVAITQGYIKGTVAVLKAGYNPDQRLRTNDGLYVFPSGCLSFQKDPAVAEQLKKLIVADASLEKKDKSKSLFDWDKVVNFLKPVPPSAK